MTRRVSIPDLKPTGKAAAWTRLFELVERIMDRPKRKPAKPAVEFPVETVCTEGNYHSETAVKSA